MHVNAKVKPFQNESIVYQNCFVQLVSSETQECDIILSLDCAFSELARNLLFELKAIFFHCINKYYGTSGSNKYGLRTYRRKQSSLYSTVVHLCLVVSK